MTTIAMPRPTREGVRPAIQTSAVGPTIMTGRPTHDGRIAITMDAKGWIALIALIGVFVGGLVSLHGRLSTIETKIGNMEKQGDRHEKQLDALRPPYRPAP